MPDRAVRTELERFVAERDWAHMEPSIPRDALILAVGPGGRTGEYIQVRTQPQGAMVLSGLLRAEGIKTSFAVQASVGVGELTALVVSIGTGLGGVAAVLSAYARRHQDKVVLIERDGSRYELRGMSFEQMEQLLSRLLKKAEEDQRRTQHLYRGISGADDEAADPPELSGNG